MGLWLLLALWGCSEERGACVEYVSQGNNVATSWCYEVERPGDCPHLQSDEDWRWEWEPGGDCEALGYTFDCGENIWEDLESEC